MHQTVIWFEDEPSASATSYGSKTESVYTHNIVKNPSLHKEMVNAYDGRYSRSKYNLNQCKL